MALRYLSPEWLAEVRARLDASREFQQATKGLAASMLNVITDAPGGRIIHLYYHFADGTIRELLLDGSALESKAPELKATGTYETFTQISQGKLSLAGAYFTRKIKIEGNIAGALRLVKPIEVMNGVLRQIPTEY